MSRLPLLAGALRCHSGDDPQQVAHSLLRAEASPTRLRLKEFPDRNYPYFALTGLDPNAASSERLNTTLYACAAEALARADLSEATRASCGLFLGSSSFAIGVAEEQYREALRQDARAVPLPHHRYSNLARGLADRLGLGGADFTFSTACTSSANALLYAHQAVASGHLTAALVVGVECFNRTTLIGFDSLQLLSHNSCRPFDAKRDGMVLGEGVAAVVIAPAVGHRSQWQNIALLGGANGCDPEGLTGSSAEEMARVMTQALHATNTPIDKVALIKAHATGSEGNDAAEAEAMRQLLDHSPLPPLTALKGALGHTLGACGVLEIVALADALRQGLIPPATGHASSDAQPDCSLLTQAIPFEGGGVLCNYFGFGGNNTSLLLEVTR